ncbi:MAG TPA: SDR family NAD(P)-dependent oxidoreductase [Acidimicrobiales bacterium]|nr:SDR family NAD(P)-dependent oxidoreductase [Acidimicrobiales bacterium]
MRIQGAAALVTGGASGLGEATVRRLEEAGAVCTILDRNAERGKAVASEIGGATGFVEADVTDPEQVAAAVAAAGEQAPLRICVNCAGLGIAMRTIARDGTPHDLDAFRFVLNINLIGTFNVLRLAASAISKSEPLEDGERGVVINTASVAAFDGQIGQLAYSASKGGIVSMTLTAARDLAAAGIRVVTIAPGTFDTPLMGFASQETKDGLAANIPFPRRMGNSGEFAALAVHVVENSYLNGETIRLDGAIRMPPK